MVGRTVVRWSAILGAVVVAGVGACMISVVVTGRRDDRRPADAIVVLGAAQYVGRPSPVLQARLDHAGDLWRERAAPLIIVTGGVGRGDTTSEAEAGRRYLLGRGIPASAILLEPNGRTTGQQISGAAAILQRRAMSSAVLVSDPFHALRLRILAYRNGLQAVTSPTRTSPIGRNSLQEWRYVFTEAIKLPIAVLLPRE